MFYCGANFSSIGPESADVVPEPMLASSPVVSSTAAAVGTQDALLVLRPAWDDVNMTIRRAKESMVPFGKKLQDNIAQGNVGERGEEWVLAQVRLHRRRGDTDRFDKSIPTTTRGRREKSSVPPVRDDS